MKFWDKITGNDINKELKACEARAKKLPVDYQVLWEKIKVNLWQHSDLTGRNIMPILESVICMLEETESEGLKADEVLGEDINDFCAELVGEDSGRNFRDKWRKKLNSDIAKKLGK